MTTKPALLLASVTLAAACNFQLKTHGFGGVTSAEPTEPTAQPTGGVTMTAAPSTARPIVTATQHVDVAVDHPNPLVIEGLGGVAEADLFSKHNIKQGCEGYVTEGPGVVLELAKPLEHAVISAPGAGVLLAKFGGKYVCASPSTVMTTPVLKLDVWPAGKIELFAGHYHQHAKIQYAIEIEDPARKRDLGWDKGDKGLVLKALPDKAEIRALAIPAAGKTPRDVTECRGFHFRKQPDLAMTLERPLAGLELNGRSGSAFSLMLVGPIPADGRNLPSRCYDDGHAVLARLEAGSYAIKIGTKGEAATVTMVVRGPKTPRDPAMLAPAIPDQLDHAGRALVNQFPELGEDDVMSSDPLRQKLFLIAPKQLFVFPTYDLDESVAQIHPRIGISTDDGLPEHTKFDYPKKNEPLLFIGREQYLSADGNVYHILPKDTALEPSGSIQLPATARNSVLGWGSSVNGAGAEDKGQLDAYWKLSHQFDACSQQVWAPFNDKIGALKREAYSEARDERIRSLERAGREREFSGCGETHLNSARDAEHKRLMASRTARRNAGLKDIAKRLAAMFGK